MAPPASRGAPPEPGRFASEGVQPISERAFERIRELLHGHSGIALATHKSVMVQSRLGKRLRAHGLRSYDEYLRILEDPDSPEWVEFVNALTTNLTSFFREEHHFSRLVAWFRDRTPSAGSPAGRALAGRAHTGRAHTGRALAGLAYTGRARLWSAGCSTGEEPYTLAMVMREAFPDWDVEILATDLDSNVLANAQRGVYPEERLDNLDAKWLRLGFLRGRGGNAGKVKVQPAIRDLVRFSQHNLLGDAWPEPGSMDAIFCRNVMIYFDKPTQKRIVGRFRDCLVPGGLLAVGHSESLLQAAAGFTSLGHTLYQRAEGAR